MIQRPTGAGGLQTVALCLTLVADLITFDWGMTGMSKHFFELMRIIYVNGAT